MSGKPKNTGWGGKRANQTGRPRMQKTISQKAKLRWEKAARRFAKEQGMTFEEYMLCVLMVDKNVQDTSKIGIAKLYNEALISKTSEQSITVEKKQGPTIGLPPMREDPALKIVKA